MKLMPEFEVGPIKSLKEQRVAAAEKAQKAAVAKAQVSSVGTETTNAQHIVTNVVQGQETKGEEFTEDAYEGFDKNEQQLHPEGLEGAVQKQDLKGEGECFKIETSRGEMQGVTEARHKLEKALQRLCHGIQVKETLGM
ncbi:hypothetical protein scyTo_0003282 [Scyliorhinus torazame]|uniref:Uncharacterized protein n=1 Tax=Scyliorhinus torazame TaxID=75743 RepID=A0A401PM62_SCYTO|nr:hypothetical protein [Scyliorhinus torazame]